METQTNNLIFAQLKKVDVEKRLVYGRAAQEHPDHAKEIMDYATSKPNFQKWSDMSKGATNGASVGNVRAMHGKVAAGKLTELNFNDDEMAFDICAKIVDDNEWKKVLEGVYTGFSIGGSYEKRWEDGDLTRYTANPTEISLVDRPCIPTATFFTIQKADGVTEQVEFKKGDVVGHEFHGNQWSGAAGSSGTIHDKNNKPVGEIEHRGGDKYEVHAYGRGNPNDPVNLGHTFSHEDVKRINDWTSKQESPKRSDWNIHKPAKKSDNSTDLQKEQNMEKEPEAIPDVDGSFEDVLAFSKYLNEYKISIGAALTKVIAAREGTEKYGSVKFADAKNKKYPIDNEEHIRAAWNYINKEKNGAKYSPDDLSAIKSAIASAWTGKIDKDGPPSAADKAEQAQWLNKGLSTCQSLAGLLQSLGYMLSSVEYEEAQEVDGSDIPARLNDAVTGLGQILVDMTAEEVAELTAEQKEDITTPTMAMAEQAKDLHKRAVEFNKIGARNSKSDKEKIQAMHDHCVSLGADCAAAKAEPEGDLQKLDGWKEELNKAIAAATDPLQKALSEASIKIAKLEAQPAPAKVALRAVAKGEDIQQDLNKQADIAPVFDPMGKESEVGTLIKLQHKHGGQPVKY